MTRRKWYRRPSALLIIPVLIIAGSAALALIFREKQLYAVCLPLLLLFITTWEDISKKEDRQDFDRFLDDHFNKTSDK